MVSIALVHVCKIASKHKVFKKIVSWFLTMLVRICWDKKNHDYKLKQLNPFLFQLSNVIHFKMLSHKFDFCNEKIMYRINMKFHRNNVFLNYILWVLFKEWNFGFKCYQVFVGTYRWHITTYVGSQDQTTSCDL